jgi:hypothetical protein
MIDQYVATPDPAGKVWRVECIQPDGQRIIIPGEFRKEYIAKEEAHRLQLLAVLTAKLNGKTYPSHSGE